MSGEQQRAELIAPREGDGHYGIKGSQWLLMCPHMSSTAKITLQLLCSMIPDTGDRRVITLDELGALIPKGAVDPGEDPKFMSASGVARVLTELGRLGQITTPEGGLIAPSNRLKGSLRIMPYRLPRHACTCSRNVYDALDRLSGERPPKWPLSDGTDDPLKGAQNSVHPPQEAQNSVREAQNSVREAQNSGANRGLTCDDAPTLTYFLPSSPSLSWDPSVTPAAAAPAEAVSDEREAAAPDNDGPAVVPSPSSAAGRGSGEIAGRNSDQALLVDQPSGDVAQVLAAYEQAAGGPALPGVRARLLADATELLTVRPLWWVLDRARELPKYGTSLARHAEMSKVPFARPVRKPVAGACLRHPAFQEDDCAPCRKAEQQRRQRPASEPGPVGGLALLAKHRAS